MQVAVAQPMLLQNGWVHALHRLLRKEGTIKRLWLHTTIHKQDGPIRAHRYHGIIRVGAIIVPAVNLNRERLRQLDALQLQIVHNQAGRQSRKRADPVLDDNC